MPKFSIIVPVYNVEKFIQQCLESVMVQNYSNYECIIVDDGSLDNSVAIAEKIIGNRSNFRIVHQANRGLSAARNTGIREALGEYIILLDSDDFIDEDSLVHLDELIDREGADVFCFNINEYYEDNDSVNLRKIGCLSMLYERNKFFDKYNNTKGYVSAAVNFIVRREFFLDKQIWFENGLFHEDELWVPLMLSKTESIYYESWAYYCNRCGRLNSITQSKNIEKLFDKLKIIGMFNGVISADDEYMTLLKARCAKVFLSVVKEVKLYKEDQRYNELLANVKKQGNVLKNGSMKYKLVFFVSCLIGFRNVSHLLG